MMFWAVIFALPLMLAGVAMALAPSRTRSFFAHAASSRPLAVVLTCIAWFWTGYETKTIGIDVFDMIANRFEMEVWILAAVLSYLTIIWMEKNLVVRAFCGLLMLAPASIFRVTRHFLPESGFAPVHIMVLFAYTIAIVGMYGMFYPWRIEKAGAFILARRRLAAACGAAAIATGAALIVCSLTV